MPVPQDVSVCLITKDEPYLQKALEHVRPWVRQIVVVLTGGTLTPAETAMIDTLVEFDGMDPALKHPATGVPVFNFGLARNKSFELARCKHVMWIDADDEVAGLERLENEISFLEAQQPDAQLMFPYEYTYDRLGNCTLRLHRERLMPRVVNGDPGYWKWSEFENGKWEPSPIHEAILPIGHRHHRDAIVWKHRKDVTTVDQFGVPESFKQAHVRNLTILQAVVAARPTSRNILYLGTALAEGGLREEAIVQLSRFVTMTKYDDELHGAYRLLSQACLDLARIEDAKAWAWKAIEAKESWLESWFLLARCYYLQAERTGDRRDWERCVRFGEEALKQPPTASWQPVSPMVRTHEIYVWLTRAYDMLWNTPRALEMAVEGLKAVPDDSGLLFNRLLLQAAVDGNALKAAAENLLAAKGKEAVVDAKIEEAFTQIARMTEGVFKRVVISPASLLEPARAPLAVDTRRKLHAVPTALDIVFACGDGWVPWDPEIIAHEGFGGGSEVAVVEMARRLAAKGHRVRVFNPCRREGLHGGVEYLRFEKMALPFTTQQPHGPVCDVLISWRTTAWASKFDAHLKLLWLHDVVAWGPNPQVPATTAEILAACDFVLCVSAWHRQFVADNQKVPLERIIQTRNGIAKPERFEQKGIITCPGTVCHEGSSACPLCFGGGLIKGPLKRDPHKVIWNMSPDRGLETLLDMWPQIRAAVPDATLHIFYGIETWKKMGHNPDAVIRIENKFAELALHGVTYRGRVPPDVLAREILTAGCWFYPNWVFPEVSCVAAMEAQAAGLRVVSSDHAALAETVRWGVVLAQHANMFFESAIAALTEPGWVWPQEAATEDAGPAAQAKRAREAFSLDTLTDDWLVLFKEKLSGKIVPHDDLPVLAPYEGVLQ